MRTEAVHTHYRCNQACTFCFVRRPVDDPRFIAADAVEARIDAALAGGAEELWFTGGEPTMRGDLSRLVAHAAQRGAKGIGLETNATLLDAAAVTRLAGAGLSVVRVHLSGWGEALDAVTRDPGGFQATLRGLEAVIAAGLPVEISAVLTRSTAPLLEELPARLIAHLGGRAPRALYLGVPVSSPVATEVLSYEEAAPLIVRLEAAARRAGLPLKFDPATAPPPCVFTSSDRPSHLFALTPGTRARAEHRRVDACATCQVADRCSGFSNAYLARFPQPQVSPIADDRGRRRLSLISTVEDQIAREMVTPNLYRAPDGTDVLEDIIRVNFHCNQSCRFCFVSTHLPGAGDEAVRKAIIDAGARGVKITLSGGEPTLNPKLVEYVALARQVSSRPVQLQSNAIKLADEGLCRALADAGLDELFVSLHGSRAEISDAVTSAPGTFARTVLGLDHVVKTKIRVNLNFVISEKNLDDLVPYVRLVAARWPSASITVSFVAPSTDVVPRDREFIPSYSRVMPQIAEAIDEARRLGIELGGFESMCGVPLCLVPSSLERFSNFSQLLPGFDRGEFVKPEACTGCALGPRCYGVRRGYVELHGAGELRRVTGHS
ncbi:MAG: radical SAM protein [Archangium sp.]|nr:radical SAM protein [Archangium sp.]